MYILFDCDECQNNEFYNKCIFNICFLILENVYLASSNFKKDYYKVSYFPTRVLLKSFLNTSNLH